MRIRVLQPIMLVFILGVLLVRSTLPAFSQAAADDCLPQIRQALQQVGDLCNNLSRNSACYGNSTIKATFVDQASAAQFAEPGDTTDVSSLQSVETAPLDEAAKVWGVSLLKLQAVVPNTLPGQSLVFVLYGDVGVENAVSPDDAFVPADEPVTVTTRSAANIRSSASTNANVLVSVPAGTDLSADATSPDKAWLRVVSGTVVGWVSKGVVNESASGLDELPVLTRSSRAPMQSFYLKSTMTGVNCIQAPPLVVVQGPEQVTVNLTVNGVDISLASTLVLRLLNPRTLEVIAVHGAVRVGNVPLPPGFAVRAPLSADGHSQDGDLVNVHPLTPGELDELQSIELIPANVLNYAIELPTISEINQEVAAMGGGDAGNGAGVVSPAAAAHVDCKRLRLTSPLDAWGRQSTTFYWDPAPGATGYRLNIDSVGSVETTSTNAVFDLTGTTNVEALTWSVQALYNGEVACVTDSITIPRDQSINRPKDCQMNSYTMTMVCK